MSSELSRAARGLHAGTPVLALAVSALAWLALWVAVTAGGGAGVYASSMSVGRTTGSAAMFLSVWEVMVVAMMFPASIGFMALFRVVSAGGRLAFVRSVSVCVGYAAAWLWLGVVALLSGETLYRIGSVDVWLEGHANLLAGGVLVLAGGFQLTALKRRCVTICSHPGLFIMRHYCRGVGGAVALGFRFGLVCLGCCWALMVLMVVLGGGSLLLMMLLTGVMFAERALGWDDRFVKIVGIAGIALGALVVASPDAVPALAENARQWVGMQSTAMHMRLPIQGMVWCHV